MSTSLHDSVGEQGLGNSRRASKLTKSEPVVLQSNEPLKRRASGQGEQTAELTARRRNGARLMAALAIAALAHRRLAYDSPWMLSIEILLCGGVIALLFILMFRSQHDATAKRHATSTFPPDASTAWGRYRTSCLRSVGRHGRESWQPAIATGVAFVIILPWLIDLFARSVGLGNGFEIVMLTSLAWGGMAAAWLGTARRTISLSVVCSGFLTLFTTFISDSNIAPLFSFSWASVCLWWLVANHWELVDAYAATQVKPANSQRWLALLLGAAAALSAVLLVGNRVPVLRALTAEVMPTSGGTGDTDSTAWKGIGSGDVLISAREHASSFGAIETDLFLDSDKPSLFDMFSDEFGEPRLNKRVERAQALSPKDTQVSEQQATEANRDSGDETFSTRRGSPKKRPKTADLTSDAILFWSGQSGVRLAVERFSHFDGNAWHPADDARHTRQANESEADVVDRQSGSLPLESILIDDRTWFRRAGRVVQSAVSPFVDSVLEAIKFTRYRSATIPTRQGMQLWSIDNLTESQFFDLNDTGILSMPGRQYVPDYTVVRLVNSQINLERLDDLLKDCSPGKPHAELTSDCRQQVARLAHRLAGSHPRGWKQVSSVIEGLRTGFEFDRQATSTPQEVLTSATHSGHAAPTSNSPLEQFFEQGRGPSYLFATAAAVMLEHLGYRTRLVTGFYVDASHRSNSRDEIAVLPEDVHVWLEINVGHGYWIPLEPTPGYNPPPSTASWWYRLGQIKYRLATGLLVCVSIALVMYLFRRAWFELACRLAWPVVALSNDRRRAAWLTRVLDLRWSLAGRPRARGAIPRNWFQRHHHHLPSELAQQLHVFCSEADRLCFGGGATFSREGRQAMRHLWLQLTVNTIRQSD